MYGSALKLQRIFTCTVNVIIISGAFASESETLSVAMVVEKKLVEFLNIVVYTYFWWRIAHFVHSTYNSE